MRGLREYRICRLCLSTGCHLVDILEESRNDEFVVKQAVEDLLQLVVLEEALYPWLVCSICLEKLRDFHFFKRRCVESQEVYDSRIRGKMWPVNQVRSAECDDIPLKSEKENAVEDPLYHDTYKNIDSGYSNQPITEGLALDSKIPIKAEEDDAIEDPLQHDACKNVNSEHSSQLSLEGLSIDYKYPTKKASIGNDGLACPGASGKSITECGNNQVQMNSEPSRNVGSGEAEELLGICEDSLSLRDPLCLDDVKSEASVNVKLCNKDYNAEEDETFVGDGGQGREPEVNAQSEEGDEDDVRDKDQCSSEGDQNSDSEASAKVEQSDNEDYVKEDETFVCECGESREPQVVDESIHGMEVECSGIEQHGAGNRVSEKGQEAISQQDSISGYTPSPVLAEGSNTDSNTASATGGTDASRMRTRRVIRGSRRGISRGRGVIRSFFGQLKVKDRFICVKCGVSFVSKLPLSSHIRAHHSRMEDTLAAKEGQGQQNEHGTKFTRSNCEEVFGSCCELGGKGFICVHCGKACARKVQLISHFHSHSGHLSSHMRTHDEKRAFECVVCNKKFSQSATMSSHMRTHDGKRPFECEVCNKNFSRKAILSDHMRTHDGKKPFECEVCNKKFSHSATLRNHMRTHDGKRPFECVVCNKKFSHSATLRNHMRTHDGKRPFECEVCNKNFSRKAILSDHMRTHDGKKPFECEVCNKKFSHSATLRNHMRIHDGKRPFECEVCNKKFSYSRSLRSHMRTHDGKRSFECEVCNKKFTRKDNLSVHMRTHDGKRSFECEVCNKKFTRKDNLSVHMRTHDGKRSFECEVCNKKFTRKDSLSVHMRTHDGKRPFECEVCNKKFSQSGNLRSHMRTHDGF